MAPGKPSLPGNPLLPFGPSNPDMPGKPLFPFSAKHFGMQHPEPVQFFGGCGLNRLLTVSTIS